MKITYGNEIMTKVLLLTNYAKTLVVWTRKMKRGNETNRENDRMTNKMKET